MAISVVANDHDDANATTIVVAKPFAAVAGDVLVMQVVYQGNKILSAPPGDLLAPTGITNPVQSGTASSSVKQYVLYHEITEASPASWTFTQSGIARIISNNILLRGVDLDSIIVAAAGDGGDLTAPSVSALEGNLLVYLGAYWQTGSATVLSAPPEMDEEVSFGAASAFGVIGTEQILADGATGTRTGTSTNEFGGRSAAHIAFGSVLGNTTTWDGAAWGDRLPKRTWNGTVWN
jgi:hypothetical protein